MIGPDVSAIGATHIGSALGERIISMQAEMEALDEQKELTRVVLQKVFGSRKILRKRVSYAATPKISAMNLTRSLTAPFSTFLTCPFLNMFIIL